MKGCRTSDDALQPRVELDGAIERCGDNLAVEDSHFGKEQIRFGGGKTRTYDAQTDQSIPSSASRASSFCIRADPDTIYRAI